MRKLLTCWLLVLVAISVSAQEPAKPAVKPTSTPAITREALEKHLAELKAGKEQALANVNAYEGAIQECQHWLDLVKASESPKPAASAVKPAEK